MKDQKTPKHDPAPENDQEAVSQSPSPICCASLDSQRLDWLQSNEKTIWRCSHEAGRRTTMTDGTIERVSVFDGWTVDDLEDARPTIREAIDYAISLHNKDISDT